MLQTLARGLEMLLCFTSERPKWTLQQLADELEIPKGSAYRTASTLRGKGLLEQDPVTKAYFVGLSALNLANASLAALQYPDIALPKLEQLAADTRGSASMAVLDGTDVVYIARASIQRVMSFNLSVGSRLPCHVTSMGKLLLSFLPSPEYQEVVSRISFIGFTNRSIMTPDALTTEVKKIRQQGYALSVQELENALASAAAPIRDSSGAVVAAINVAMETSIATQAPPGDEIIQNLLETAFVISRTLGYRPGRHSMETVESVK